MGREKGAPGLTRRPYPAPGWQLLPAGDMHMDAGHMDAGRIRTAVPQGAEAGSPGFAPGDAGYKG